MKKNRARNIYPVGGKDNNKKGFRLNFGDHYKHLTASHDNDTLELSKYKNNSRTDKKFLVFEEDINRFATNEKVKLLNDEYIKERYHKDGTSHKITFDRWQDEYHHRGASQHKKTWDDLQTEKGNHKTTLGHYTAEKNAHGRTIADRDSFKRPCVVCLKENHSLEAFDSFDFRGHIFNRQVKSNGKGFNHENMVRMYDIGLWTLLAVGHYRGTALKIKNAAAQHITFNIYDRWDGTPPIKSYTINGRSSFYIEFILPKDTNIHFYINGPQGVGQYHNDLVAYQMDEFFATPL